MDNLNRAFLGLSTVGIIVAIYHGYDEVTHYSSSVARTCDINSFVSCVTVFNSGYTKFLGVSLYIYGLIWFPLVLVLGHRFIVRTGGILRGDVMLPLLMVGNAFTLYLWYLELDKIHALCPVCISMYSLNYAMTAVCVIAAFRENQPQR